MRTLFLTGATGFLGRHVLARADRGRYGRTVALSRSGIPRGFLPQTGAPEIRWQQGDVLRPGPWQAALGPDVDVIHGAAATGSASPALLAEINVDGTAALIRACRERGVRRFVFVSSIAASWPDDPHYPYAQTKHAAERLVESSGLAWTIARPTIILGPGSPLWPRLRTLATLPVPVLIGDGRVRIQPVLVDDCAAMLLAIVSRDDLAGATIELGGPDVITMADFLARVRGIVKGGAPTRALRLPYGILRAGLVGVNTVLAGRSPVGPGQLTSFVRDGTAKPHPFTAEWSARLSGIDAMIRASDGRA